MRKSSAIIGKTCALLLLLSCIALSRTPAAAAQSYSYSDIHPPGWIDSRAVCMNAFGEVAGYGTTATGERGFLWAGGKVSVILPPGADSARAAWVNGRGDVAGTFRKDGVPHAFLLVDGVFVDPTPGWANSEAAYLGEDGAVGGTGSFGAFVSRGGTTEIHPGFTVVTAGNSSGQLVGRGGTSARLYLPGKGYLDLTPPGTANAAPRAINENGRVAVTSLADGVDRGYVYSEPFFVSMTPAGWTSSRAAAINNLEMVVGYGDSPNGRTSFVRSGGSYEILSFPGWSATEASAINDLGQVAGAGTTGSGETHAFVAYPAGAPALQSIGPASSGGGCVAAPGGGAASGAASLLLLYSPLFLLRRR